MASNEKVYKLTINGLTESISQVEALNAQIDDLMNRLDKLASVGVKIDVGGGGKADIAESTVELEKQREIAKELAQVNKQIAQGARDADGNYANTLKGRRAELAALKKTLSSMELGTKEWAEMSSKVNDVNDEVKNLEKSFGVFNRQVGNYEIVNKGMDGLKVKVGDVEREFTGFKDANKTLSNEMAELALKMREMTNAGQGGTEEFKALQQQFEDTAKASESLTKAKEYSDRLKNSIQDDSGALGEMNRTFDSVNAVINVGVGAMGLFADNTEDVQKAINRTVQVTTVLKGVTVLMNKEFQQGTPLMKAYNAVINGVSKAFGVQATSAKAAQIATKAFSGALIASGIGAIVVLIGYLVNNFDELKETLGISTNLTDAFGKAWDKVSEVLMGVSSVIFKFIITPIRTAIETIKNLIHLDFKAAFESLTNGIKEQYDVIGNYQSGAQKQHKKNIEKANREQAKAREKDLNDQIKANEAKYGSDWKYTKEGKEQYEKMFAERLKMYAKDSDEYKQAMNDKTSFDREWTEHANEASKKATEDAKRLAKQKADELAAIEKKIEDNMIEAMKDGFEKELKQLKIQERRELEEAEKSGIKVQEQKLAIQAKYNKIYLDKEKEQQDKISATNAKFQQMFSSSIEDAISKSLGSDKAALDLSRIINEVYKTDDKGALKPLEDYIDYNLEMIQIHTKIFVGKEQALLQEAFNIDLGKFEQEYRNALKSLGTDIEGSLETIKEKFGDNSSKYGMFSEFANISNLLRDMTSENSTQIIEHVNESFGKIYDMLGEYQTNYEDFGTEMAYMASTYLDKINAIYDQKLNERALIEVKARKDMADAEKQGNEEILKLYNDTFEAISNAQEKMLTSVNGGNRNLDVIFTNFKNFNVKDIISKYDALGEKTRELIENNDKELESLRKVQEELGEKITAIESYKDAIARGDSDAETELHKELIALGIDIENLDEEWQKLIADFAENRLRINGIESTNKALNGLMKNIKDMKEKNLKDWKEWANSIAEILSELAEVTAYIGGNVIEAIFNNTMNAIDKQMEALEEETVKLEEEYAKQEEIEQMHKDRINEIEDELSTARGDRRLALLDRINAEVAARERAFANEKAIMAKQKELEKKREELNKKAEEAEKKKNKQEQKINIMAAIMNTALGITSALKAGYPLGILYAAVIAAMGASQIALIASQKFANGGVIEGKSHAQGGVKVLGGSAEVEGGEFITNKRTTAMNVGLLEYINSKNKQLSMADIEEYFSGRRANIKSLSRSRFAKGGALPDNISNIRGLDNMRDNRPIVVSVKDFVDEATNYKNVLVLSGEMNAGDSLI